MKTAIVLGLGFGDEGKGLTTSFLCHNEDDLVIRFNGGHQAGHTVNHDGISHVFSSFGAGTLQGAHTYWSEYCTFYPVAFFNELILLREKGITKPTFFLNPFAPLVTPFDIAYNQAREKQLEHGSVGVGFGATIERHTTTGYKLYAQDLLHENVLVEKLYAIQDYYESKISEEGLKRPVPLMNVSEYLEQVIDIKDHIKITELTPILYTEFGEYRYENIIFEGAQGILLDMDFGFFPNVTRSNTTSKNALDIIHSNLLPLPEIFYVTRCYQTRHGNGFMSIENVGDEEDLELQNIEDETNISHTWQGEFRIGHLDIDLLNYSLTCDNNFSKGLNKNLVVTCLDQTLDPGFNASFNDEIIEIKGVSELAEKLNCKFHKLYASESSISAELKELVRYEEVSN